MEYKNYIEYWDAMHAALDPERFGQWLRSKEPGEVVGYAGIPCMCPVARYMAEQGFPRVHVGYTWYYQYPEDPCGHLFGGATVYTLPPVFGHFAMLVDAKQPCYGAVTAAAALDYWRQAHPST